MVRQIELDGDDRALVEKVNAAIDFAVLKAHQRSEVARRISALAMRYRDQGRAAAIKRHRFMGECEVSGLALKRKHAILEQLKPELGYAGGVRWVCQRAHDGGKHSCGGCASPKTDAVS